MVDQGYIVTAGSDAAGYFFYVLNLSNGKTAWDYTTPCIPYPTTPVVVSSLALLYGCDSEDNPTIEARNLGTGMLVWSLPDAWTFQRGDFSGKQVFATNPAGAVVALNPLTGQEEYTLGQAVSVLAVDNSRVYAACGSDVCAYNVSTGAREWRNTQLSQTPALGAAADSVLYLDFGAALNAATGKVIKAVWSPSKAEATALAVGDGRIAAVTNPRVLDLYGLPGY